MQRYSVTEKTSELDEVPTTWLNYSTDQLTKGHPMANDNAEIIKRLNEKIGKHNQELATLQALIRKQLIELKKAKGALEAFKDPENNDDSDRVVRTDNPRNGMTKYIFDFVKENKKYISSSDVKKELGDKFGTQNLDTRIYQILVRLNKQQKVDKKDNSDGSVEWRVK